MSDLQQPGGNGNYSEAQNIRVHVLSQYVRDLSFENPAAPTALSTRPQIELNVDVQARKLDPEHFEVELKIRVSAKMEDKPAFLLELVYAGLLAIQNAPEEILQQILLVDAPHMLFPFARRVVADAVRDGGMPPLMIEPIDFAGLYRSKMGEVQRAGTA